MVHDPSTDYPTPRAALAAGAHDALGAPIAVMAAGYVGYGALASGFDFPLLVIVTSTLLIFALPGQLIMLEMHAVSAQLVLTILAVSLSASRFPWRCAVRGKRELVSAHHASPPTSSPLPPLA